MRLNSKSKTEPTITNKADDVIGSFNWNDIVHFLALARSRNLAAAGKQLNVDNTTVGRRVRELEACLNVKLFARKKSGFILTDAGQRLLVHAEAMETTARDVSANFAATSNTLSGTVRVGTMEALGSLYLAERLSGLGELHPEITIELVTASNWINLTKREADLLISFPKPNGHRLICKRVGEFQLRLYATPRYLEQYGEPSSLRELEDHRFVDYISDLVQIQAVRWLSDILREPNVVFRSSSLVAQYHAVLSGQGIGMLPSFVAARDPRLKPILTKTASVRREFWLSLHEDLAHIGRVLEVGRFLTRLIQKDQPFLIGEVP